MNFHKLKDMKWLERLLTVFSTAMCTIIAFNILVRINDGVIKIHNNWDLFKFIGLWAISGIILYYIVRVLSILITYVVVTIKNKLIKRKEESIKDEEELK